jgi:hypothetical protein
MWGGLATPFSPWWWPATLAHPWGGRRIEATPKGRLGVAEPPPGARKKKNWVRPPPKTHLGVAEATPRAPRGGSTTP